MGSVIVPEAEGFLGAVKGGGAGEICADPVPVLVLGQHFLHLMVTSSPFLSRKRNLMGVIFPSVSVQEIICTGISTHRMLSIKITPFLIEILIVLTMGT